MGNIHLRNHWIYPDRNLVYVRFTGLVSREDTLEFARALLSDPMFRPGLDELIDARDCEYSGGGFDEILEYRGVRLESGRPAAGKGRWACVVSDDLMYGLSRMFGTLASDLGVEMRVFRDMDEALGWLGQQGLDLPAPRA